MNLSLRRSISKSVFLMALCVLASSAMAGPQPKRSLEPSITVQFSDLNPATPQGSRMLYARISAAAAAVCAPGVAWYPTKRGESTECYRATVDHVVAKLNLPALTALHFAKVQRLPGTPDLHAGNP
jgi:UrcA family protein